MDRRSFMKMTLPAISLGSVGSVLGSVQPRKSSLGNITNKTIPLPYPIVSMVVHKDRVFVATTKDIYIVEDNKLKKLKLITK